MANATKQLKDLNLLDRFLFAEAMDDPENMKILLDIILGQDTLLKALPQTEKETRTSPMNRFIRLDVYSMGMDETIYETEVQKENTKNLPCRSRLYQGMIDSKLLQPGSVDFNEMNQVFIIIIMPFDLFGHGLYRYTYRMMCEEVPGLSLDDGATRIFLNTHGTNPEGVSSELIELLRYMEASTDETSRVCQSERIHRLNDRINSIKSSEEIGVKFMQEWEERILEKQEACDQLLMGLIRKKIEKGLSPEEIADLLETDLSTVQQFIARINGN